LDLTRQQTIEGPISSVQIALGLQYPTIVVNQATIRLGPVRFLLDQDFELKVGERVRVQVAPSLLASDPGLVALSITKISSNTTLTLRDANGMPLWTNSRRGPGNGQAEVSGGGACVDPATIAVVEGIIESVNAGLGIQHPTLTLRVGEQLLTFKLGPEWYLLENDFVLKPGAWLRVKYAAATCIDELLALALTNEAGVTVVLRGDNGTPAWR
jgi:hypothetical protein